MAVQRALISVFDKTGIVEFAKRLAALKIEILSTGGPPSCCANRESPCATFPISRLARNARRSRENAPPEGARRPALPSWPRGRPEAGGATWNRANRFGVVNLYPFEATAAKAGLAAEEMIENIDIGGPAMLRSAAKNFESVTVVTDSADFERVGE